MRDRLWPIWLWLAAMLACALFAVRAHYRTDMGDFLPKAHSLGQTALEAQVNGGGAAKLLLVSIDGASAPALEALNKTLASRLRKAPEFAAVLNGDDTSLAQTQAFVWKNRYLLSPGTTAQAFSVAGLHQALKNGLALLGSDLGGVAAQTLPADPTDAALGLAQSLGGTASGPQTENGVWMSPSGHATLLLLRTQAPGFDLDAQQRAQAVLTRDFSAARLAMPGAAAARLRMTGPGVFAVQTRDVTKRDVTRLSLLASAGAVLFLLLAYRSPLAIGLGLLPVASGALAGIAAVSLVFGFVHAITLGFGVTLIGEALDYSVYLLTQTRQEGGARATMARIWPTLRLGALTSIAGFAAMLGSSFTGFAQLGVFSMAGLATAVGVTRFVLPRLVPDGFFARGAAGIGWPLRWVQRRQRTMQFFLAGVASLALLALGLHGGGMWQTDLLSLSPLPPATQALDKALRAQLGIIPPHDFLAWREGSEQQALAVSEALEPVLAKLTTQGALNGFSLPSQILPSRATQQARRAALPDDAALRARFSKALSGLPFQADAFAPFFQDVAAARTGPLLTPASLPPPMALKLQSMLTHTDKGWVVLAPLGTVKAPTAVRAALPPGVVLVSLNRQSALLLRLFEHEAEALAICGSLAILVILAVFLRTWRKVARVALPLGAAVLVAAAALTLGGGKLSIFMVAGFLLIVAVGSNYCLFFAGQGEDGPARERAFASIMLANLCTVAAYGVLSLSVIPVLHDIGETVALGTFLCLLYGAAFAAPAEPRNP
ncbi:MAG: MMPL family transporter [Rhodospirillales bacterium]|nr:MMPL family transporter [Pseudomonadota bacterium]MDE2458363.1 MMPL family transporter [Rhodospirillales bacterium]